MLVKRTASNAFNDKYEGGLGDARRGHGMPTLNSASSKIKIIIYHSTHMLPYELVDNCMGCYNSKSTKTQKLTGLEIK